MLRHKKWFGGKTIHFLDHKLIDRKCATSEGGTCQLCSCLRSILRTNIQHIQNAPQSQFAKQDHFPVYGQLCAFLNKLENSLQGRVEMHKNRNPHFWLEGVAPTTKHYERHGYQQVFGYSQISQRQPLRGG